VATNPLAWLACLTCSTFYQLTEAWRQQDFGGLTDYEEGGTTMLATLKPTTLLAMFNTPQLAGVAQEVEDTIVKIMQEAAAG
jgi:hypothetical protein